MSNKRMNSDTFECGPKSEHSIDDPIVKVSINGTNISN